MAYTTPDSVVDPSTSWTNEANTKDGNQTTYAYEAIPLSSWSGFLEFTLASGGGLVSCDKVRVDAERWAASIANVDIDTSGDGGANWDNRYEGAHNNHTWTEHVFAAGTISINKIRVRYQNVDAVQARTCKFYEIEFNEVPAAGGGQMILIQMSKLLFPFFWLKQGLNTRRGFIKNTILTMLGMK